MKPLPAPALPAWLDACRRPLLLLPLLLPLLLLAGLLACMAPARAQSPLALAQSFSGSVNLAAAARSLRAGSGADACRLAGNGGTLDAVLSGIPDGALIQSAQLYWAGSGATPDYKVSFDGAAVSAPAARQYAARVTVDGVAYAYFSGAADVTSLVAKKGNGSYAVGGLAVDSGDPWCAVQDVFGGFALLVVYSHPREPYRQLSIYEGFQDLRNSQQTLTLGGLKLPNPLPATATGRVAHVTWGGDQVLSQGGEDLLFNEVVLSDATNPAGQQFNSASNVSPGARSYGLDVDVYTLPAAALQAGQTSAALTYRTGADMVLLGVEAVALPYAAGADLALGMVRSGELAVGKVANYTLTVSNAGPDDELGPVTVVDTLPAGLALVSAGGSGWNCADAPAGGQTVVTCTQAGPLKVGAQLPPLVIAVSPASAAGYTNTARVYGRTGDPNNANDGAADSANAAGAGTASLVLTAHACRDGEPVVVAAGDSGCHRLVGPLTAADAGGRIHVTAVAPAGNGGLVARARSSADTTLALQFKFSCLPNSNVAIAYAGASFSCNGTAGNLSLKLPGGAPTAVLNDAAASPTAFAYADIGRLSISFSEGGTAMGGVDLVSRPRDLRLVNVLRAADNVADLQGSSDDAGYAKPDRGFARAGEQFKLQLCARMANGACAPGFGKEAAALAAVLPPAQLNFDFRLDLFAVNLAGTPKLPIAAKDGVVREAFVLDQAFTRMTAANATNMYEARARWFEAGLLGVTPSLSDYLGSGRVGPAAAAPADPARMAASTRVIGRFYPDHFETTTAANFACPARLACPVAAGVAVTGGAYSMQPFAFGVRAYGLPRQAGAAPAPLSLYQNLAFDPAGPGPLRISAGRAPNLATAPLAGAFVDDPSLQVQAPAAPGDYPALAGVATWRLGTPYDPANRGVTGNAWGAPTAVYLRASATESRSAANGAYTSDTVSSLKPAAAPAGTQYEEGLMLVAGRLFVPNVFGSNLLRLPVGVAAQYWSGSAWVGNPNDEDSVVASALQVVAGSCRKGLASDPASGSCVAEPLRSVGALPLRLRQGKARLNFQAPTRGTLGSVDYLLQSAAAPWLPSTQARASFGLARSPLLYLREVY